MEIKHKGSQISEREKQRILNNLSSDHIKILRMCNTEQSKEYKIRKYCWSRKWNTTSKG